MDKATLRTQNLLFLVGHLLILQGRVNQEPTNKLGFGFLRKGSIPFSKNAVVFLHKRLGLGASRVALVV